MDCFPLEIVVCTGRCHVVCMERGMRPRRRLSLAKDKFEDKGGNLFCTYPLHDDPQIAILVLALLTLGRSHDR